MNPDELPICPFCRGKANIGKVYKGDDLKFRVICSECGCSTPWCSSEQRAMRLWCNRDSPRPRNGEVAKILCFDGTRQVDVRTFSDMGAFHDALRQLEDDGWNCIGSNISWRGGIALLLRGGFL